MENNGVLRFVLYGIMTFYPKIKTFPAPCSNDFLFFENESHIAEQGIFAVQKSIQIFLANHEHVPSVVGD
ncbi:hypothetical protein D3C77_378340 [compost metagenome]